VVRGAKAHVVLSLIRVELCMGSAAPLNVLWMLVYDILMDLRVPEIITRMSLEYLTSRAQDLTITEILASIEPCSTSHPQPQQSVYQMPHILRLQAPNLAVITMLRPTLPRGINANRKPQRRSKKFSQSEKKNPAHFQDANICQQLGCNIVQLIWTFGLR
jgi:hypothetical protein